MLKNLTRYDLTADRISDGNSWLEKHELGAWVKFSEVKELLNTSTNKQSFQFPELGEVVKSVLRKFPRGYLPSHDGDLINHVYNFIVGNKKH